MRGISAETLSIASRMSYVIAWNAQPRPLYGFGDFYYGPVIDGKTILDVPSREFDQGHFHAVGLK
jgi:hypothetical protein